jgi:hypothetical protein
VTLERLLVVWCPSLLREGERAEEVRQFLVVLEAVRELCPWVEPVRLGVCALPARGPSRFFGGEKAVVDLLTTSVAAVVGSPDRVRVGVADGLFAATLAARSSVVVASSTTPSFLAPWSLSVLGRSELAVTLQRLGVHTLGQFAALPRRHVLARFGADGAACHAVARGEEGELPDLRDPAIFRRLQVVQGERAEGPRQPGFFGGASAADARAARVFVRVQDRLGSESVLVGSLRGGRSPSERAQLVPWGAEMASSVNAPRRAPPPWPGRLPAPSPAMVLERPASVELFDIDGRPLAVSGRGLLSAAPWRFSVDGGPFQEVAAWAGPWPSTERWWASRRRRARLQVVTTSGIAALVALEGGHWSLEGIYD